MSGAATTVFNAQIKGTDESSSAFAKVAQSMRGLIGSVKSLTEATKGLGHASEQVASSHHRLIASLGAHFRLLRGHLGSISASVAEVRNSLAELVPAIGALGAGASLVGLFELTHSVAEASVVLEATAIKTGNTIKGFAGLAFAAKLSGVPVETMTGGLEKLNKTLGTLMVGHNKAAAALFKHLHINPKNFKTTADMMPALADAFQKTRDKSMQAWMAVTLFGKAGQELLPVLTQGGEAIKEMAKEGARLAFVPLAEQREEMRKFADSWIGVDAAIAGFKTEIGAELAPVLKPVLDMVKEWIVANRHWIATGIADRVKQLVIWLKQIDVDHIVTQMTDWVRAGSDLVESLGGMKTVLGALVLMMGSPLLGAVSSAIEIFTGLGRVLLGLTAILWANPILLAVAAVAAAALFLYYNWDWVKQKVGAVFTWFSSQNAWVQALLIAINPFVFLPMEIYAHWEPIKAFFTTLWTDVTAIFNSAMAKIKPIIDTLKEFGDWISHISLSGLTDAVKGAVSSALPTMVPNLRALLPATHPQAEPSPDGTAARASPWFSGLGAPMPGLYREGGPVATAATPPPAQKGTVTVNITGANLPPGAAVTSSSSGIAQVGTTDVGHISPMPAR